FQPEAITPLTTGVIALLRGAVRGNAEIAWDQNGTTSSGTFTTDGMDFAASFGPVEGLATTIHFNDLLGLTTAPNQLATTRLIRTGIDVLDGQIRYQLLPGLRVKVESGRWPFAGGELILEETILDFSKPSAKILTFRVEGLDAARFVQQMEFSNISATGTFDGTIPMVFDERGGRIVGGILVARPEGGTLSYIGELTDKELGVYGKLAFDALKSMRYDRLILELNGSLEGEFIAGIKLDGIARDPSLVAGPPGGGIRGVVARRAISQVARIPFKFNIKVKGPFRTLIATTRSLEDPTNLIQSVLPDLLRNQPTTTTVQPQESENKP
ncbi:MAG: intermembrane phospholipid transport protein YdbH family protein, partial [Allosphingosinicella sp.]